MINDQVDKFRAYSFLGMLPIITPLVCIYTAKNEDGNLSSPSIIKLQCLNNCVIAAIYGAIAFSISKYAFKNNSHQNLMVSSIVAGSIFSFMLLFQTVDYALRGKYSKPPNEKDTLIYESSLDTSALSSIMMLGIPAAVGFLHNQVVECINEHQVVECINEHQVSER